MLSTTQNLLSRDLADVTLHMLMRNILGECRDQNDIGAGESLFGRLLLKLELEDASRRPADLNSPAKFSRQRPFTEEEMKTFRKAVATIVRYSGDPALSRKYVHFLLTQVDPPLRDQQTEITCLINIIYVYCKNGSAEHLEQGLDFVKIGLERGLKLDMKAAYGSNSNCSFRDQTSVFATVSLKILRFHNLYPSPDGLHLQDRPSNQRRV